MNMFINNEIKLFFSNIVLLFLLPWLIIGIFFLTLGDDYSIQYYNYLLVTFISLSLVNYKYYINVYSSLKYIFSIIYSSNNRKLIYIELSDLNNSLQYNLYGNKDLIELFKSNFKIIEKIQNTREVNFENIFSKKGKNNILNHNLGSHKTLSKALENIKEKKKNEETETKNNPYKNMINSAYNMLPDKNKSESLNNMFGMLEKMSDILGSDLFTNINDMSNNLTIPSDWSEPNEDLGLQKKYKINKTQTIENKSKVEEVENDDTEVHSCSDEEFTTYVKNK